MVTAAMKLRLLHLGRKAMTNLDSMFKSRDTTLPTKVHIIKTMKVFPVVIYGCESWTIKMAEHQRINTFELWCWIRLLRVVWTARKSNQSILKEINPEYSLEGLMLKLKYSGHLMQSWLTGKAPDTGKDWRQKEKGVAEDEIVREHHQLNGHEFEQTLEDTGEQRNLACCSPWVHRVGHDVATQQQHQGG